MNTITSNPLYELSLSAIGTIESHGTLAWIGMRLPRISIVIGESITVTVIKMTGNVVQLGIDAPREIPILRSELHERIRDLEMSLVGTW